MTWRLQPLNSIRTRSENYNLTCRLPSASCTWAVPTTHASPWMNDEHNVRLQWNFKPNRLALRSTWGVSHIPMDSNSTEIRANRLPRSRKSDWEPMLFWLFVCVCVCVCVLSRQKCYWATTKALSQKPSNFHALNNFKSPDNEMLIRQVDIVGEAVSKSPGIVSQCVVCHFTFREHEKCFRKSFGFDNIRVLANVLMSQNINTFHSFCFSCSFLTK